MNADLLLKTQTLVSREWFTANHEHAPAVLLLIDQHRFYRLMLEAGYDHEERWTQAERDYRRGKIGQLLSSIELLIEGVVNHE